MLSCLSPRSPCWGPNAVTKLISLSEASASGRRRLDGRGGLTIGPAIMRVDGFALALVRPAATDTAARPSRRHEPARRALREEDNAPGLEGWDNDVLAR